MRSGHILSGATSQIHGHTPCNSLALLEQHDCFERAKSFCLEPESPARCAQHRTRCRRRVLAPKFQLDPIHLHWLARWCVTGYRTQKWTQSPDVESREGETHEQYPEKPIPLQAGSLHLTCYSGQIGQHHNSCVRVCWWQVMNIISQHTDTSRSIWIMCWNDRNPPNWGSTPKPAAPCPSESVRTTTCFGTQLGVHCTHQ